MDVLSPKERLLRSLKGEAVDRAPVICPGGMMNSAIVDVMKNHGNVLIIIKNMKNGHLLDLVQMLIFQEFMLKKEF